MLEERYVDNVAATCFSTMAGGHILLFCHEKQHYRQTQLVLLV